MTTLVLAIAVLAILGIVFGLGLAVASRFFVVHLDPKVEAVNAALPQVNCGACGYSGCMPYAEAVAKSQAPGNLCVPGGANSARKIAEIMGLAFEEVVIKRAYVHCQGGKAEAIDAFAYEGVEDCRAAALVHGGPKACKYGCLGFGTCRKVCPFGAITMSANGLPVIDHVKCTGCGICVKNCPTRIISLLPLGTPVILACSSLDFGAAVKKMCSRGCISCQICAKVTTSGAVMMQKGDPLPKVRYDIKEETFEKALDRCPMNCYVKVEISEEALAPLRHQAAG